MRQRRSFFRSSVTFTTPGISWKYLSGEGVEIISPSLVIPKKIVSSAVRRNKLKRHIREALRLYQIFTPGLEIIGIVNQKNPTREQIYVSVQELKYRLH